MHERNGPDPTVRGSRSSCVASCVSRLWSPNRTCRTLWNHTRATAHSELAAIPSPVQLTVRRPRFEPADAWKRLGLIALATDLTSERDFARLMPHEKLGLYTTRVAFENPTTPDNLMQMGPRLTVAAALLLPGESLDAVCYSCTAASVVLGDDVVRDAIQASLPGVPVITPSGAARLAFAALGIRRISVLTPYVVETSLPMAEYFERHGLEVARFECFGLEDDRIMARVTGDDIVATAVDIDDHNADALFISCTGLPAVPVIAEIEARIGKPVVSSNQASIWAMLRHAGLEDRLTGYGRLFKHDLPAPD